MANIIDAIINLVADPQIKLKTFRDSHNRINSVGESLEEYIKDLFANTTNETNNSKRNREIAKTFSYVGNQNNPPDAILRGGDAIEVKKIESDSSTLALNSSYPKAKLFADSPMISKSCMNCEDWSVKDMIYTVGVIKDENIKSLAFVYGDDYCAERSTYERIKSVIKSGVESIENVEFALTNELGRVNRVDPLGITYLRIRGMWGIENPFYVFDYVYKRDNTKSFNFMAIINSEKYYSFDNYSKLEALCSTIEGLEITDVEIKNPNNPAQLKKSKLISFKM